jgi:FixJ family two-component response regulator
VIIACGVLEFDVVVKAQKLGAIDFLTKPFPPEMLRQALDRAVTVIRTRSTLHPKHSFRRTTPARNAW